MSWDVFHCKTGGDHEWEDVTEKSQQCSRCLQFRINPTTNRLLKPHNLAEEAKTLMAQRRGRVIHFLKAWSESFQAVWDKQKVHEVRRNDRFFETGDTLVLSEWDAPLSGNETDGYTGRQIMATVQYITKGGDFGLPFSHCVMSIKMIAKSDVILWVKSAAMVETT